MENFPNIHNYEKIMILVSEFWNDNDIIKQLINKMSSESTLLIKDDNQSRVVRRLAFIKRLHVVSVPVDDSINTNIIIKGDPDYSILLTHSNDNTDHIKSLLKKNDKKYYIIISDNKKIKPDLESMYDKNSISSIEKHKINSAQKCNKKLEDTNKSVNNLDIRQKSKKKMQKQIKKLYYFNDIKNNNPVYEEKKKKQTVKQCMSMTNSKKRCTNNALENSDYCGIKSHC